MTTQGSVGIKRKLSMAGALAFGLSYMAPGVVLSIFGAIAATSGGAAPTAFAIAAISLTFTALSYAKLARIIPSSGSAYTYARRLLDSRIGFLVGWAILLDYLFLPSLAWLFMGTFFHAQFSVLPVWAWLLITAAATTAINVLGVVLADWVNRLLLAVAILMVVLFSIWCTRYAFQHGDPSFSAPWWNSTTSFSHVTSAAAVAAYAFLGFEAISTLSGETREPERSIPRAIVLAVSLGGVFFVVVSYIVQLAVPGADHGEAAYYDIARLIGGRDFANIINTMYIVGGFASCMAIQSATARLLFVMGRDGVFPRKVFGNFNRRFRTPVFNLILVGLTSLISLWSTIEQAASFINFGALLAYASVNLCVIAYYMRNRRHRRLSILGFVVLPSLGVLVCLYLVTLLDARAIWIGVGWLAVGIVYLTVLTRGFTREPPEMQISDREPTPADSVPQT
ncbi:APC family permease [Streptomyces sp. NBC_00878]|uniref:APC family permease n=1 Tax=Streptomyces sp. NBC_00878 TaxID=2975854 RepID=UPI00224F1889|nr:APC family permease [Streptomyces sp. NBC_00878]MCX4904645.1 APC family permease [Streptomyces sp. NBC_00878]